MIEDNWIMNYIMVPFIFGIIFGIVGIGLFVSSFFSNERPFWVGLILVAISLILLFISFINNKIYENNGKKNG